MTAPDTSIDAALDRVALSTTVDIVTAEPANFAGIAAVSMAQHALNAGDGGGDWTISDGPVDGRRITLAGQSGITITTGGTAAGLAYADGSTMHYYSPLASTKQYDASDVADIPSYDVWTIRDPA